MFLNSFQSAKSMPKLLLWGKSCLSEVAIPYQGSGVCDPQTLTSWYPISKTLHSWNIHHFCKVSYSILILTINPLGRPYPKLVWTLNQWITICSSFIDQLIGSETTGAFVSAIQIVISLDRPLEPKRKYFFSKINQNYNLALKLLRLKSKRARWQRKAFISLPSHL